MIRIYKFEIVVPDYEDKGRESIKQALLCDRDTYGWVINVEEKDVEFFDNRDDKQINELFGWQPLETAPRDGTRILFFYGLMNSVFTGYYEDDAWWLISPTDDDFPAYFDTENPANCYWQPLMELPTCK